MCREKTVLILCVLALCAVCSGAEIFWSDGAADDNHLWTDPDNWEGGVVPGPGDEVQILSPQADAGHGPIIQAPMDIKVVGVKNEMAGRAGEPELTMTGGNLEITDFVWWGDHDDIEAYWYHQGGNVTVANEFELGWGPGTGGAGTLDMTGGTISAGELVVPTGSGAYGRFYLHGGTFTVRDAGGLEVNANGLIDITEGTLVLEGDVTGQIESLIADGRITAYDGAGYFDIDYDLRNPGMTAVTAAPLTGKAYRPDPADGAENVTFALFKWGAGLDAALHDVYVGTSPDTLALMVRQPVLVYWYGPGFAPDTTYYWRIDEVDGGGAIHTGDLWSFTTAPSTAYNPTPRDGAKWIDRGSSLGWSPGMGATSHDVYFGTDKAAVEARDPSAFVGKQVTMSYDPGTLAENTTYYWSVDEHAPGDMVHAGSVWRFTTIAPGGGVKAQYFGGTGLSGVPLLTRLEDSIDHDWGNGEVAGGHADQVSARWTAELEAPLTETYTLITTSDDGVQLWLDGWLLIDNWTDHGPADDHARVDLVAGQVYSVRMEWYEKTGGAVARLSWQSASIPRQIIPAGPLHPWVRAAGPYPAHLAANVTDALVLRWNASESASRHDVYFGDDADAIAAADTESALYQGRQSGTTFDPGLLEWGKVYSWRVDEVNDANPDSPWKGRVWSFRTADFVVVDDFEHYTDNFEAGEAIFQAWIDGLTNNTGSTVGYWQAPFAEQTLVHGGRQAMPLDYNNVSLPYYSEARRTWENPQDWTKNGVDTLTLYVRGNPGNSGEQLYVGIDDKAGHTAVVVHPDPAVMTAAAWTEWRIPLSSFDGMNAAAVKSMYLGAGDPDRSVPGGTGLLYIDDIRVIRAASAAD